MLNDIKMDSSPNPEAVMKEYNVVISESERILTDKHEGETG